MIIELATYATTITMGIYDSNDASVFVELFAGADATGAQRTLSMFADGSVIIGGSDTGIDFAGNDFGFYLDSTAASDPNTGRWYSDTLLNSDNVDHMAAYAGVGETIEISPWAAGPWTSNEFILNWEDQDCDQLCDGDYTDFVVIVESVSPIPEPTTLALLGMGLLALAGAKRRRSKSVSQSVSQST